VSTATDTDAAGNDVPQDTEEGVTAQTAAALREAMDRLLAGRPQRTDGRLVKDNLWKEAGVSRATMNRARLVMAEWQARVAECDGLTPGEARKNDEVHKLRAALADKTRECTQLHHQLDAAATAIAALHHDNTLLREELGRRGEVVDLDTRRSARAASAAAAQDDPGLQR
jgi:hypothetical protein